MLNEPSGGEVAELLQALIRNRCVNDGTPDSGHEHRSVETICRYLGADGCRFEPRPGRTNVLFDLPGGDGGAPKLTLMGHLDVVPVNERGWSQDPFAAEVVDGFVWGRGAVDMLNQTAAMAAVFKRFLKGTWEPPAGGLSFLAVADEEAGGTWGAGYLTAEHWGEVACDFLLTEIAYPALATPTGPACSVSVGEKGPYWRRLRVAGTPGHASQPYGTDNALIPLARVMARLGETPGPVVITPEWRTFVEGLGLPPPNAAKLVTADVVDDAIEELAAERPAFARYVHACTHLTVAPTVLHSGTKTNMIPDEARAEVDLRALPGQDLATVDDQLRKVAGPDHERLEITPVADFPANSSPAAGLLWDAIVDAIGSLTGSRRVLPTLMPATTDARFFRSRGTVAYGLGLFDDRVGFDDFLGMFHGNDERVSIESLELTAAVLARTVRGLG